MTDAEREVILLREDLKSAKEQLLGMQRSRDYFRSKLESSNKPLEERSSHVRLTSLEIDLSGLIEAINRLSGIMGRERLSLLERFRIWVGGFFG